jgi:hypothetical protein
VVDRLVNIGRLRLRRCNLANLANLARGHTDVCFCSDAARAFVIFLIDELIAALKAVRQVVG